MTQARLFRVRGRVQGVGFRAWACGRGAALGLAGWARNEADGSVMVHAEGDASALHMLRADLREGPPLARVASVEEEAGAPAGLTGFEVAR